ncbi:MAG: fibrobacter succinogenes major paralogous domain-containing protein [Bacteroidota bacterium]
MKKRNWYSTIIVLNLVLLIIVGCKKEEDKAPVPLPSATPAATTVTDVDGNVYHTITIGTQTWMVENLKVTHYRNGDPINHLSDPALWTTTKTGAYCNYENLGTNGEIYGRLYNWYALVEGPVIAPTGWHIPTNAEWQILVDYLGGVNAAGGKLKEEGLTHWQTPNTSATNQSGFAALPSGVIAMDLFIQQGSFCNFWTVTESDETYAWRWSLNYCDANADNGEFGKVIGCSVRCIKD